MKTNLEIVLTDFAGELVADRWTTTAKAEFVLRDPHLNQARIEFLHGVALAADLQPADLPVRDYSADIAVIERLGVLEALDEGRLDPDRLNGLLCDPAGLRQACVRLAASADEPDGVWSPTAVAIAEMERLRHNEVLPNELLERDDLRRLLGLTIGRAGARFPTVEVARDRDFLLAFAHALRRVRRENAAVLHNSGGTEKLQLEAVRRLELLNHQDALLKDLEGDEELKQTAAWYRLAEDAALEDEEIAALWGESVEVVRETLNSVRVVVLDLVRRAP